MNDKTILFSGLPNSGKTTFIAALWYFLFNSSDQEEYTFDTLENSELEYLNTISLNWASCDDVIRTPTNLEDVRIGIKNKKTNSRMILNVPDIKGERFKNQFEFRQWEEDFEKIVDNIEGLLLFIDPRDVKNKPRLIYQENKIYRIFGEEKPVTISSKTPWTEDLAPSQVKIVDFLQMLDYHRPNHLKRIAILVSCWDVVIGETDPKEWCKKHIPLLYQYITTNSSLFESKYFGVSSQGGDYEKNRTTLLKMDALDRISVTDGSNKLNILSPILWLTNEYND